MGLNNTYGLGRNVRASVQNESVFGDGVETASGVSGGWASTDSMQVMGGVSIEPAEDRKVRADARQTRSAVELIQGQRSNNVTVRSYVLPPNAPGTGGGRFTPDVHPLLVGAMGRAVLGGADVVYNHLAPQSAPPSCTALFEYNGIKSDLIKGWAIEEFRLSVPNGDEPTFEFTGPAKTQVIAGASAAASAFTTGPATPATFDVTAGDGAKFEVGAYINVGSQTNLRITAVSGDTLTVVNGANPATVINNIAIADAVVPYTAYSESASDIAPSTLVSQVNGSIQMGPTGSLVDVVVQAFDLQVKNNFAEVRPMLESTVADFNVGFREVTGNITFFMRDVDILRSMGNPRSINSAVNPTAIELRLGSGVSGSAECVVNIPNAHLNFAATEIPEAEMGTIQVPFVALAGALSGGNSENECSITFRQAP